MNEARFMELLGAYGADLSRWPEDDRGSAGAFLEVAPHRVRDIWESERAFDLLLACDKDVPASIALESQIVAASPDRRPVASMFPWRFGLAPKWAAGGALAASLALGFVVGYASEPRHAPVFDYANMLVLSGGGAGSVFLTAINDGGH